MLRLAAFRPPSVSWDGSSIIKRSSALCASTIFIRAHVGSRRYVATTDSDHDQPIYPNLAKEGSRRARPALGPRHNVAITTGRDYVAAIRDAWSGRVVGYAPPVHRFSTDARRAESRA